jgi:hypothetical protein
MRRGGICALVVGATSGAGNLAGVAAAGALLPSIHVPNCDDAIPVLVDDLQLSSGAGAFPARTAISLCWTPRFLFLRYHARDDLLLRNDYSTCNSETYNQEVVELFISDRQHQQQQQPPPPPPQAQSNNATSASAAGEAGGYFVTRYLEVEVTPQDTLYVAHIRNPYGNGTNKTNLLVDCTASGIEHRTAVDREGKAFEANVSVPWALINGHNGMRSGGIAGGDASSSSSGLSSSYSSSSSSESDLTMAAVGDRYVGNFFRVLMQSSVALCDPDTCAYGAWSPTLKVPPQFHVSTVFGDIYLV